MKKEEKKYYSKGKLLLTGEYLVMKGAKALAFPTRYGQSLEIDYSSHSNKILTWKAYEPDGLWFEAELKLPSLHVTKSSDREAAFYLASILSKAISLNPAFEEVFNYEGISVETHTNFPIKWGLGTSSTLIVNIARWAEVSAFDLHKAVSKGSGYDIACATASSPILFNILSNDQKNFTSVNFNKPFLDKLWFVYSGKKKRTENHIQTFLNDKEMYSESIARVNDITSQVLRTTSLEEFISLIDQHENIIGKILKWKPVKEDRFLCFNGAVKSLGAWGGDFLLVASPENKNYVHAFFEQNGLSCIIPFKEMVL